MKRVYIPTILERFPMTGEFNTVQQISDTAVDGDRPSTPVASNPKTASNNRRSAPVKYSNWHLKGPAPLRVRNHVNPLNIQYQTPVESPNWEQAYGDLTLPFHLDIGTGPGRFLITMAEAYPDWNFLGVEIRRPLVERANAWVQELGLKNIHFLACNINVTLPHLFSPGDLDRISIQFPDPWFKVRHHKRRVVQPAFVQTVARLMTPGTSVFLQSDIEEVAVEMEARFAEHSGFINVNGPHAELPENPFGVPTSREQSCVAKDLPIYRYWLDRRDESSDVSK